MMNGVIGLCCPHENHFGGLVLDLIRLLFA